jgi:histidine triad (HIT) family protein
MRKFASKGKENCRKIGKECIIALYIKIGWLMNCLFCKIAQGEMPTAVVFENDQIMAFRDLNPQAPKHVLIIPKRHIATINEAQEDDQALLGAMILAAKHIAQAEGLSEEGYRLVFNTNPNGGQTVFHIHLHLLGGRQMTWPPG